MTRKMIRNPGLITMGFDDPITGSKRRANSENNIKGVKIIEKDSKFQESYFSLIKI